MEKITLSLSIPEINLILEALGRLPYAQVYELIGNVQEQARAQLGPRPVVAEGLA
ncbi:hypothetical protein AB0K16_20580 [Nonomuraea jabiensis]|uniref:hypothetical protein n=1 Tax=Nonomuraea jabiensis TaxID=882448 RepID=UPI0034187BE3